VKRTRFEDYNFSGALKGCLHDNLGGDHPEIEIKAA